ncbi:MAG TPA: Ig-like domain-containing protein [Kofleriaceae bacterium]|nr:Ig-like domain-containing protein [Kofleriaceae bacterium]
MGPALAVALPLAACGAPADRIPAAVDQRVALTEDQPVRFALDATDPDGDGLTWTATPPAHGHLAIDGAHATYTPSPDFAGTDHVEVTASDGETSSRSIVVFDVAGVEDAPRVKPDTFPAVEDAPLYLADYALLANDNDPDGDRLRVVAVTPILGGDIHLGDDEVVFTPAPDRAGLARFAYTVSDGQLEVSGQVVLRVGGVEDAPVVTDDVVTTKEDEPLTLTIGELLRNDTDPDGDTLVVSEVDDPVGGAVELDGNTIRFTPAPDFHGDAGFVYRVSDGREERDGHVSVEVQSVDDVPDPSGVAIDGVEDQLVVFPAALLREQAVDADGDPLIVIGVDDPVQGSVGLVADEIRFVPAPDADGAAGFRYTVSDGFREASARVEITLAPVDDPPIAYDQARVVTAGTAPAFELTGRDVDDPLTFSVVQGPRHGQLLPGSRPDELRIQPDDGFVGDDSMTFVAHGGARTSAPATITFLVRAD